MGPLVDLLFQSPILVTLLGSAVLLLVVFFLSGPSSQEQALEPPGPRPLPLLGNLLLLDLKRPYITLFQLSKKYGSVFTVHYGSKKVVVLAGYKTVKQALVNYAEEFGDREINPMFKDFSDGHGIVFANGDSWKEMRRFALTNLRDFGMGKKAIEEKIIEESHKLIEVIAKYEGKAFDTAKSVIYAVSNIICSILYGSRFEYDDPEFRAMVNRANETFRLLGSPSVLLYNTFPWLGKWMTGDRKRIMKNVAANKRQMTELIRGLKETLNPQMCRCFVDAFLAHKQKLKVNAFADVHRFWSARLFGNVANKLYKVQLANELVNHFVMQRRSGNMNSHFHMENLLTTLGNLFAAGTDTTASTLKWSLLLMAKFPHIQDQVQEELTRVIGSRQVRVEDRKNLPYTDAVIHETQRLANILPISVAHTTSQDVTFQGFFIKKGTTIYPLLTSVLWDESEWESPHTFNPAHFLDKDGHFVKRDALMPFSAGRRMCPGESLARMEIFLFFTSLLQHFRFTPPPGITEDELDLTPTLGATLNPSPHQLCAISQI